MGEGEAQLFAAEGAKVVVADILAGNAEAVAATIRAGGGPAIAGGVNTVHPGYMLNATHAGEHDDKVYRTSGVRTSTIALGQCCASFDTAASRPARDEELL